jgi:sterol desaturase/sphingolipid hydroxylase (fatty acid hydroxylase superfamily)
MNDLLLRLVAGAGAMLPGILVNTVRALLTIVAIFIPIWYLERRQGADTSRYGHRNFAHDVAYALFYDSGVFRVLGASLIWGAVQDNMSFARMGLLEGQPILVVGFLYLVINDFVSYWLHRAEHSIPLLWQFHSLHHMPEELNFLTAQRVHPFSKIITLIQIFLATVQHTNLDWSYGRLYPVLVSPVFHRLHHSRDRRDFDSNYSQLFGIWDYLFGTANPSRTPPVAVGVEGLPPEPTLIGQFLGPFRRIARPEIVPEVPTGSPISRKGDRKKRMASRT